MNKKTSNKYTTSSDEETSSESECNSSDQSTSSEEEDFEHEVFNNDYLILYKLGSGAFSTVWLTYQISTNDFYALKIQNHDSYSEGVLEKNCLETVSVFPTDCLIKLIASFDIIRDNRKYLCLVLELAIDSAYYFLKQFKDEERTGFPPAVIKKLHDNVCEGISYLHAHDLLHTDIKPENILVCGNDKRLKVIKDKMNKINFKNVYESQINEFKKKFDLTKKKDKLKFRRGKKKILLQIITELTKILKIEEIYDDLKYLEYTEEELLNCTFKIADLGTIHSLQQMIDDNRFPCIQTRYYRAPKVILGIPYDQQIDYWSIAIMYYELIEGELMFNPHHTDELTTDQVHLYEIIQWINNPELEQIKKSKLRSSFDKNGKLLYSCDYTKPIINSTKWHPEILQFFRDALKW